MAKINFKEFPVHMGIAGQEKCVGDARETFANIIYTRMNGIRAHALAMKIYRSEGIEEYSKQEISCMVNAANEYCTPAFIDGLMEQIKTDTHEDGI